MTDDLGPVTARPRLDRGARWSGSGREGPPGREDLKSPC